MQWTQRDLAREWGVAPGSVAQWELGDYPVPGPVLKLLELVEQELGLGTSEAGDLPQGAFGRTVRSAAASFFSLVYFSTRTEKPKGLRAELSRAALEKYIEGVGKLKGLSMKMAQMASYTDFCLTVSQQRKLGAVQRQARPMSARTVMDLFLESFKRPPRQLFRQWEATPFAVGSIGQVHRAVTQDGAKVAVKVRHRGLHAGLAVDLAHLSAADRLASVVLGSQKPGVLSRALREHLMRECDYRLEAEQLRYFADAFRGWKGLTFPQVRPELSNDHILVESLLEGQAFEDFCRSAPTAEKDRRAQQLWEYFQCSCYEHSRLNVDPHPGNFVFTDDGIGLVDFGAVQQFSPEYLKLTADVMRCVAERQPEAFRTLVLQSGIVSVPERADMDFMYRIFALFFLPWLLEGPFRYEPDYVKAMWNLYFTRNPNLRAVHFSEDMLFFHQYFFGMASLLARMNASITARPVQMRVLYGDKPRPPPYSREELARLDLGYEPPCS